MIRRDRKVRLAIFLTLLTLMLSYFGVGSVNAQALIWTVTINPSDYDDIATGVAVDATGVYIVGSVNDGASWRVMKRTLGGGPMWSVTINPSADADIPSSVAVDATGLYVAGSQWIAAGDYAWRIEKRSLVNGGLLWFKISNPSSSSDEAHDVAVGPTGVYVVGFDMVGGDARWRIERRSPATGALLVAPMAIDYSASYDIINGVAVGPAALYVVGFDRVGDDARWRIERRSLITLLPLAPPLIFDYSAGADVAYGVAVDSTIPDTGVYVVGYDSIGGDAEWRILKRTLALGPPGWPWPAAGLFIDPSPGQDRAYDVAVNPTAAGGAEAVYVVGSDQVGGDWRWRLEARTVGGALAPGWPAIVDPSAYGDAATSVAVDAVLPNTGVYIAGYGAWAKYDYAWMIQKRAL